MNTFFLEFRDPLFGIIIFFVLIFVITFFSYWFAKLKKKEDYRHLDKFLKQFHSLPSQNELKVLITKGELSEKSWLLLASSYTKNGNYEKSIEIYSELLKVADKANYRDTLFLLGKTYFKAGFLERAKQIFLEILKNNPRTPQALSYLLLVYEQMRNYNAALEVLDSLSELKKDVTLESAYLNTLFILNNVEMTSDVKVYKLLEIYKNSNALAYLIFEYLFRVNPKAAWENFDTSKAELLVDVLWRCDKKDLNLDTIMQNGYLKELYTAKGYIKEAVKSSVFELDVLINLDSKVNATLGFEYICNNCKVIYPFAFSRCSSCHAIDSSRAELSLVKDYHKDFSEENNSFQ
ncbi:tetratricopeptide repeat protein [Sulfurimonas sp.]|jgi:tetratricopeptide (TPR) repeat protein|uniref:tetratricopeptide repeat protein n=1 Tax=Sulfurimonas sp. TaxID=2022749 RepID=UPI0025DE3973|nr:tetratricopeptide repeat protein [Sulfurimonas sp.]MCK9472220.1 tetratricopeptide repeat protein [Sulfurimonas sp.]MDD3505711.1 tetratricopeptide repeat protein [Sulfurimonas sp.]